MDTTPVCPVCGKSVVPGAPQGLCPECLMKSGFETKGGNDSREGKSAFVPPSVEETAGLFPQLEIIELLGCGGMGAVYRVRQPRLNRFVALKILSREKQNDPQFAERFEREARTLASLTHPNIVTVYDFGEVKGRFYLLMEFVDGLTLRQLLRERKLSPAEALIIVPKICEALQFAHEQGVIHRDIKPENILLDKKGQVKIADFGIAKIMDLGSGDLSLTGVKDVVGTPHYMAPEQIEEPQAVDGRADIYSLGVVFYEMLTGELPLGKFQLPSQKVEIDVRLDQVVLHALEKEPNRRYQQASQLKTDVETIVATRDETPLPTPVRALPATRILRRWKIFAALGGVGLVAVVLCLILVKPSPVAQPWTDGLPRDGLVALWSGEGNGDDSTGTNNAILTGMAFANGKVGRAFSLNGHTTFARIPASPSLDMEDRSGLTVSAWIKPMDVSGFHPIVEWYSASALPHGIGCQLRLGWRPKSRGMLVAVIVDMDGHYHVLRSSPDVVVTNRFQYVAVTYDQISGVGALYLNGRLVDQSRWRSFPPKTKGDLWISYRPFSHRGDFTRNTFFSGLLDEVAIYSRALTPNEIQTYYHTVMVGESKAQPTNVMGHSN